MNEEQQDQSTLQPELSFHCVRPHNQMIWTGNIDSAFKEFFKARLKKLEEHVEIMKASEENNWPEYDPEIGKGKRNVFIASNGIMIWYESNHDNYPETLGQFEERFRKQLKETVEMAKQYKEEIKDLVSHPGEIDMFEEFIDILNDFITKAGDDYGEK